MDLKKGSRIAVIGAGISGIAAANILQKNGFVPVVFEKQEKIGGVWATAYPEVHLQNICTQYHLSDLDWPFKPDLHPSGEQIMRYLSEAVQALKLDIRLNHEVIEAKEESDGWGLIYKNETGVHEEAFEYLILAAGQYTDGKNIPHFLDEEIFKGQILTEREITSLDVLNGKRVVIVGGKNSAAEAALELHRGGAHVTLVHRRAALGASIKYWVKPDIENRIAEGSIAARFESRVVEITPQGVVVEHRGGREMLPADRVFLLTGYHADFALLAACGLEIDEASGVPLHDPSTLESTSVPGVFLAGGVLAGKDTAPIFIENGRFHGERIVKVLAERMRGGKV